MARKAKRVESHFDGFFDVSFGFGGSIAKVGVGVKIENRVFRHDHKVCVKLV